MAKILTKVSVENIKPVDTRQEIPDARQPGLYLIVQSSGVKSWAVRYRHPTTKKPRKMTLGKYPALSLADARSTAAAALIEVDRGSDPAEAAVVAKEADRVKRQDETDKIENVIDRFIKRYSEVHSPKSAPETRRLLTNEVISKWKGLKVQEIGRKHVAELLDDIMERPAPYVANRTLSALSRLGNWCVERGIIEQSFASGVKKPAKEQSRDRVLSDDELIAFWRAADEVPYPFGPLTKLLLVTAQRREEVGAMSWNEIDLDARLWTLQGDRTKNGQKHEIPLTDLAIAILTDLPRIQSPSGYVFTTTGITPASGFSKVKRKLDELMTANLGVGLEPWRYHDLRRTAASGMARLRQPPHVVEAVLNHKTGAISGVAAVYNRHDYLEEKSAALNVWSSHLESLTAETDSNVISMVGSNG